MTNKINLICALAALVFFFVPWLGIEWQDEIHATQSGVQMMMGTGSSVHQPGQAAGGSWGYSYLSGIALVALLASFLFSFAGLLTGKDDHATAAGFLCFTAFSLLVLQGIIGFPVKAEIMEARDKATAGWQALAGRGVLDDMLGSFKRQVAEKLECRMLPWFGFELAVLGLPVLLLALRFARASTSAPLPSPRMWGKLEPDER